MKYAYALAGVTTVFLLVAESHARTQCQDCFQDIDVAAGQGLTGRTKVIFHVEDNGDVRIDVAEMELFYSEGAHFNNMDKKVGLNVHTAFADWKVEGFLSITEDAVEGNKPLDRTLAPMSGHFDENGSFRCSNCGSLTIPAEKIRASDHWISGIVVDNSIFFNNLKIPTVILK